MNFGPNSLQKERRLTEIFKNVNKIKLFLSIRRNSIYVNAKVKSGKSNLAEIVQRDVSSGNYLAKELKMAKK